jgi:hypothetical protein
MAADIVTAQHVYRVGKGDVHVTVEFTGGSGQAPVVQLSLDNRLIGRYHSSASVNLGEGKHLAGSTLLILGSMLNAGPLPSMVGMMTRLMSGGIESAPPILLQSHATQPGTVQFHLAVHFAK